MKRLSLLSLMLLSAAIVRAQFEKTQIFKVDTAPGRGYEVMFIGTTIAKKVNIRTDAGMKVVSQDFYRPGDYTWAQAKIKIDSMLNLNAGWSIPTTAQLKTIFTQSQADMDKKRIGFGSLDYEGINGAYWCCNTTTNGQINIDSIYNAGSFDGRRFVISDSNAKRVDGRRFIDDDNPHNLGRPGGKITDQLLFIRKY